MRATAIWVTIQEHSPTAENPDLVRCDCGGIWRILTPEQIRKKFAHLGAIAK